MGVRSAMGSSRRAGMAGAAGCPASAASDGSRGGAAHDVRKSASAIHADAGARLALGPADLEPIDIIVSQDSAVSARPIVGVVRGAGSGASEPPCGEGLTLAGEYTGDPVDARGDRGEGRVRVR